MKRSTRMLVWAGALALPMAVLAHSPAAPQAGPAPDGKGPMGHGMGRMAAMQGMHGMGAAHGAAPGGEQQAQRMERHAPPHGSAAGPGCAGQGAGGAGHQH